MTAPDQLTKSHPQLACIFGVGQPFGILHNTPEVGLVTDRRGRYALATDGQVFEFGHNPFGNGQLPEAQPLTRQLTDLSNDFDCQVTARALAVLATAGVITPQELATAQQTNPDAAASTIRRGIQLSARIGDWSFQLFAWHLGAVLAPDVIIDYRPGEGLVFVDSATGKPTDRRPVLAGALNADNCRYC